MILSRLLRNSIFIFFALFSFFCETASQNTRSDNAKGWTIAEGTGTIIDNEVGKAKDDALNDAKRDAVKKVLGTLIQSKTEIDSGVFQSSELTAKAEGLIETYEILESRQVSNHEYYIKIKAKVSKAKIEAAIEDMISQQARPIMLVIMKEDLFGAPNTSDQTIAQVALETEFTRKGFPLVDRATFEKVRKRLIGKYQEAIKGNSKAAREIGELTGAEIVIVGDSQIVSAGPVMEGSKMMSVQSDISVRVIETTTGSILATDQEHAAYPHINIQTGAVEASKKSSSMVAEKLISEIAKKWKTGKVSFIDLSIQNASYEDVKKLRSELLEKVRGVKAVHRKESAGDLFFLVVEFEGDAFNFADRIVDAKLSVPVKVGAVKRNHVELIKK